MVRQEMLLFAPSFSAGLGHRIADLLEKPLALHEERSFPDGEHKIRPLTDVRGADVYVVASLHGGVTDSVNDRLCRCLFFLGALQDAGAERVTAILPYLCYARKDRRSQRNDPLTMRYVAQLFEAMGVARVVTFDVHNLAAFENAFRCATIHESALNLLLVHARPDLDAGQVVVCSPDLGGIKRAEAARHLLQQMLERDVGFAFMEKYRAGGAVSGEALYGNVGDATVLIVDDLVSTGLTLGRTASACWEHGAKQVLGVATHGLFGSDPRKTDASRGLDRLIVTDTVERSPSSELPWVKHLETVSIAPTISDLIARLHAS